MNTINDDLYNLILESAYGFDTGSLWLSILNEFPDESLDNRKEIFLDVMSRLLKEGKARLALQVYLEGSTDDQINQFRDAWPQWDDIDEDTFWVRKDGVACTPGGLVWVYENGAEVWT
ncbi:DUF596 domain-containing protein [Pseudomonas luteola]|uniref:DUF596 domain-containing protein n=1 Tax=Pseudomonas luteola TaxID=47886 RepID=UPI0015E2B772|nr:DUF596 domain-containing protein [Pseudomonas zeshuii]MBA1250963.1 DUF596 domain-containing protein [Pseudomonas zeshuii]